jgi:Zn-dependent protease
MKKSTLRLAHVLGIPIGLDPSWFLIFALFTWVLAANYFPLEFKNWTTLQYWVVAALTTILFFFSVLLHEIGHSIMAIRYKLTVKSIKLYIFGGVSEITSEPKSAMAEFVIAFAGPFTSLLLAGIFYLLSMALTAYPPLLAMTKYLAYINAILAAFNLIPGFPLDGGRVFRSIVWGLTRNLRRATEIAALLGHAIAFFFILLGVWELFQGNWVDGLWIAFIGWFLETAVVGQVQQQQTYNLLSGHTVDQIMSKSCIMTSANLTLQELVDEYVLKNGIRCMVVMGIEQPVGLLTLHDIRQIHKDNWGSTIASQVMTPMEKVKVIGPKVGLAQALDEMGKDGVNQMPVMEDGQIEGMLSRQDIVDFLKLLKNIEK